MANAERDDNFVPTLLAVSSADGTTPVPVYANPTTHRLLTDAGSGVTGPGLSTDNAIARWDGTTGAVIQNSPVTVADTTGNIGVGGFTYSWPGRNGVFVSSATGTGAPNTTPTAIGQIYVDTNAAKVYISTGVSSSSDWTIMN